MLAGVFEKTGSVALQEKEMPTLKSDLDVKIKVLAASICGTDVHILSDPPGHPATTGIIQGHEYMGEVVEIGKNVKSVNIGDRVIVDPTTTCGSCYFCEIGKPNMCEHSSALGIFLDGGWTSYSVVPSKNVFKISKEVAPEIAVLAEPLSCVIHGSERVNVQPGDSVVIVGGGSNGAVVYTGIKSCGCSKNHLC
ncbi:alcohol dehydrogenase catalytic domain-containing protein [Ectobacillus funiculus]|uniref:Alcohol dehydrogenase catalytic domain-containing protein n=1 Tax=Ectobacillus funiculus TaxID=137993 RepID=A0ABV5WPD8_9BACI